LPDSVVGKLVQCPSCAETFTAALPPPLPPPPASPPRSDPRPSLPLAFDAVLHADEVGYTRRMPHRARVILTLRLLVTVFSCIPPAGWLLGGFAIVMANRDLGEMAQGRMDNAGRTLTRVGKAVGLAAFLLATVYFLFLCVTVVADH